MDPVTEGEEEEAGKSRLEEIKYYTSLFLGTLAICCLFAFLFVIPFTLDPAISTMLVGINQSIFKFIILYIFKLLFEDAHVC